MKRIGNFLSCLFLLAAFAPAQAQTVYGTYDSRTRTAVLTASATDIAQKFRLALEDPGAQITEIQLLADAEGQKFLLTARVGNSREGAAAVGIDLTLEGGNLSFRGPGFKHTCIGAPCDACRLIFGNNGPVCRCDQTDCASCKCNHKVEFIAAF
jgi:hypothetical protein